MTKRLIKAHARQAPWRAGDKPVPKLEKPQSLRLGLTRWHV
jgi:hypothetical protein